MTTNTTALAAALERESSSDRLQAALTAGTAPRPEYLTVLVARSAVEPDFFVRDMLTWAIVRHDASVSVPLLLREVAEGGDQARSQSLHTLSKIGDERGWRAITSELLRDKNDEVARSAWRAAAILVPPGEEAVLAESLASQLGRGDATMRLSLSRAFAALGDASLPTLERHAKHGTADARAHAIASARLVLDPDATFDDLIREAVRAVSLQAAPALPPDDDAHR
ncbi:HEAT repeat protein [Microbacteriaceae bacterium SG_E_30_P1]|uniref:HEAT repeat protein n=1 Tax=Antiquaquibacter oligotrophicus TaxID=2880260 RepID=A0ABT6KT67_9MICO|nr:HEAT repeat domain-containing protein [Antiquaquibacter oligotrophicus]MDH6182387.1 HEAT repeat protein [Antiquaquibacter oligotrophicus]UDF14639.1 HEAT repeat domain-containing protein [Antiquaquibacter oligotrophicus]